MANPGYDHNEIRPYAQRVVAGEQLYVVAREIGMSPGAFLKHCILEGYTPGVRRLHPVKHQITAPIALKACGADPKPSIEPQGKRIAVIPDMQVKPGIDFSYCSHIGQYLAHKKPDIIVNGGDFADMPSLCTHDAVGSMGTEGQRYSEDIFAVQQAMEMLMTPIRAEMRRSGWNPRLVLTLGNHEDRIARAVKATPKLQGTMGLADLHYKEWGWEVIPFLEPVVIEGIVFSHYFCSGVMGKPITTARALLSKLHMSSFAFHQQGRDVAFGKRADGTQMISIIAGSCYPHNEGYLNPQTNNHWRGLYVLNDVKDGAFEEMAISLKYLARKYGK